MTISLRKWLVRAKYAAIFIVLTVLLYGLFHFVSGLIEPMQRYREPAGKAVKVFRQEAAELEIATLLDRLRLFYWYGE